MKAQWIIFADEYVIHSDHMTAYMKAYPNTKDRKTASTKGLELLKKPAVLSYIDDANRRKAIIIDGAREAALIKAAQKGIMSEIEVDKILCEIIAGTRKSTRLIVLKGKIVKVDVVPEIAEQIQAIDKFYKRYGSYAPIKHTLPPDPLTSKSDKELEEMLAKSKTILNDKS